MLLLVGSLLAVSPGGTAGAETVPRIAGVEVPASPYGFDQVVARCPASAAVRSTRLAYAGNASLLVHTEDDPECDGAYARGIFEANAPHHLTAGDDFWFGAAFHLPVGFWKAHTGYTDLLRVDSYVNDGSARSAFADRAEINLSSWEGDDLYVRAARGDTRVNLIGPVSPAPLPEGVWIWVEVHVRLGSLDGTAYTELRIDGRPLGASTAANLFPGAAPLNRLRYGIVSTDTAGSGDLTAYVDRASVSRSERGPRAAATKGTVPLTGVAEAVPVNASSPPPPSPNAETKPESAPAVLPAALAPSPAALPPPPEWRWREVGRARPAWRARQARRAARRRARARKRRQRREARHRHGARREARAHRSRRGTS